MEPPRRFSILFNPQDSTGLLLAVPRHAAGIIDFVELKSQTAERMGKVFKPKAGSETGFGRKGTDKIYQRK